MKIALAVVAFAVAGQLLSASIAGLPNWITPTLQQPPQWAMPTVMNNWPWL